VGLHPSGRAPGPTCGSFDLGSGFEFRSGVECAFVVTFVTPRPGGEFRFDGGLWLGSAEFGCDTFGLEFRAGFGLEFSSMFGGDFGAASSARPTFKASLKRKFGAAAEARSKRNRPPGLASTQPGSGRLSRRTSKRSANPKPSRRSMRKRACPLGGMIETQRTSSSILKITDNPILNSATPIWCPKAGGRHTARTGTTHGR